MPRSRGANALLSAVFESAYGTNPGAGTFYLPFLSSNFGGDQDLAEDDTLGMGRGRRDHERDALNVNGDITLPFDSRYIGYWLKLFLGAPTTAASVAASLVLTFTANPAAASTITLNATSWSFVASGATGNQVNLGANLAATLTALAVALNASVETQTAKCTYTAGTTTLTITNKTLGSPGNSYTVALGGTINGTLPTNSDGIAGTTGTLLGGANTHTFIDGLSTLPSMSLEFGNPEVPSYALSTGVLLNMIKFSMGRTGLAPLTASLIGQNEVIATATAMGTPTAVAAYKRFAQKTGDVRLDGVQLGSLETGDIELSNNYDIINAIRGDGLIEGADPAIFEAKGTAGIKFGNTVMLDKAVAGVPVALKYGYARSASEKVDVTAHRVFLKRPKRTIDGPAGVKANFSWEASRDPTLNKTVTIALTNDMAGY